jgi:FMN phosphatase YigB (HAD superfamily)
LFIDDSPRNVKAAQALGWQAIHFTSPQALRANLIELNLLTQV